MADILAFRPRPKDRDVKVVFRACDYDENDEALCPAALKALDDLFQGPLWVPGQKRPRGCLTFDIEGSGIKFVLKIVTQSDVPGVKVLVSQQNELSNKFISSYGRWSTEHRIPYPTGYLPYSLLHTELIGRRWMPTSQYNPNSGLGMIFGYRKDEHNVLIVQVEYNPFYSP